MNNERRPIYQEVQRVRQWYVWLPVLGFAAFIWYGAVDQLIFGYPFGENPMPDGVFVVFWGLFGVLFPIGFAAMNLTAEVRHDGLYIRYFPFHVHFKKIAFQDIESYRMVHYRPIRRFGGWGIRFNLKGERAYNMSGSEGVEPHLRDGLVVVIGSRRARTLKKALDRAGAAS